MKKSLLLLVFILFYFYPSFSQTLYSSTADAGYTFNPGAGAGATPPILLDDVLIPGGSVTGSDSVGITYIKFGIIRDANAPAVTIKFYYTTVEDTATMYATLIKIPPVQIGSVDLPANGASPAAILVTLGDSVSTLFSIKTDIGAAYTDIQTFFLGMSFSNTSNLNAWAITTPGAPESDNDDVMWFYDENNVPVRRASYFGPTSPSATFYMEVFGSGYTLLPVTLSDFTARKSANENLLKWSTQQESNTSHFVIERSTDGQQFANIGQLAAAGNSSTLLTYHYSDVRPAIGNNYYRIKTVDKDGKTTLSEVRQVSSTQVAAVKLYPNPAGNKVTVAINIEKAAEGNLSVTDLSGKVVYTKMLQLQQGNTTIPVSLPGVAAGSYIMKIQLGDELIIRKFNKQ